MDYRDINQKTRPDKHQLPRIDDLLDQLVNAHCLSSMDLHIGYHKVAIHQGNECKTAFLSCFRYGLSFYHLA